MASIIRKQLNFLLFIPQVLQKLGKADETKDEQFEQVVINFKRQEVRDVSSSNVFPNSSSP